MLQIKFHGVFYKLRLLIVRNVVRTVPLFAGLVLLPFAWNFAGEWLLKLAVPPVEQFSLSRPPVLVHLAEVAWNSVVKGGMLLMAIDAARGKPLMIRSFTDGFRFFPRLMVASSALLPLWSFLEWLFLGSNYQAAEPSRSVIILFIGLSIVSVIFYARTWLWGLLIVDTTASLGSAFQANWLATRGHVTKLLWLAFQILMISVPLRVLEIVLTRDMRLSSALHTGVITLALACVYVQSGPQSATAQVGASGATGFTEQAPLSGHDFSAEEGSGWARPPD